MRARGTDLALIPASGKDQAELRLIEAARDSPSTFARLTKADYQVADLHEKIGDVLAAAAFGDKCDDKECGCGIVDRVIIEAPPRHGKSELASVRFPAWYLGNFPDRRIIGTAYGADLARGFGRKARDVISHEDYPVIFPGVRVSSVTKAADDWEIEGTGGGYIAAGVGGPITGRGCHVLLIEDPIKNREDAKSEAYRDKLWEWYTSTAYTRLEGRGVVIIIQTRWHEDDLVGRLEAQEDGPWADKWHRVTFRAIDDEGNALWPAKFPKSHLNTLKAQSPRDFASLYQQTPAPDEGSTFKEENLRRRWDELPEDLHVVQFIDTSFKTGVANDFSVISTWGRHQTDAGVDYYLIDAWRKKVEYPALRQAIEVAYGVHRPRAVYIEDAASGQSVIQDLKANTSLPVIPVKVEGTKENRADAISPIFEANRVLLPAPGGNEPEWLGDWIHEHLYFPSARHDDYVDTTSGALGRLSLRNAQVQPFEIEYGVKTEKKWESAFKRKKRKEPDLEVDTGRKMLRVR